ncbi:tetratricopeptide repeat protein [Reyranella sp.]|uniref:tetratricopeptide repeat protein n=1 Tax=Reyranella sp. TaxID=1929291 RepID=UPI003BACFAB1
MTVGPLQRSFQEQIADILQAIDAGRDDEARAQAKLLPLDIPRCRKFAADQLKVLAFEDDSRLLGFAEILHWCARGKPFDVELTKPLNVAAKILLDRGDWARSAHILGLVLSLFPNQPLALLRLSNAMIAMGQTSKALAYAKELLLREPWHKGVAKLVALNADAKDVAELGDLIAPLAIAWAEANPDAIESCVRVLALLMCSEQACQLLSQVPLLSDAAIAKAAFDTAVNTSNPELARRAITERRWGPEEALEQEVWRVHIALLQRNREQLAASFHCLAQAGRLDLLGRSSRQAAQALGLYAEAFSGQWAAKRRRRIAELIPLMGPGEPIQELAKANVLIIAYTHLGDQLQPLELVDRLRELCASCTIAVDRRIANLVARGRDNLTVIGIEKYTLDLRDATDPEILRHHLGLERVAAIDQFDKVILITDLQPLLVDTESNLPRYRQTLRADPVLRGMWRDELSKRGYSRKVGLFWRSGRVNFRRSNKATRLKDWTPILDVCSQALLVNLQFGSDVSSEIGDLMPEHNVIEMPNLDTKEDIESVAALMCELDLVITTPGTTMHLAGALGVRTLAVTHPSQALFRARADGVTGTWSKSVEIISGPPDEGFAGAILATARRLQVLWPVTG